MADQVMVCRPSPQQRAWFLPPDAITEATGLTQVQRKALKRLAWTGPTPLRETPHPLRMRRLFDDGLVEIEAGVASLSAKGRAALAAVERLERGGGAAA